MQLEGFGVVFIFILGAIVFLGISFIANRLLRPDRPSEEKLSSYESGEEPTGKAWGLFNIRFYVIAIAFILFEVELVFLFPWALIFTDAQKMAETNGVWGWISLLEMLLFIGMLAVGLAYLWKNNLLTWAIPNPKETAEETPVPNDLYNQFNNRYSGSRK